MQIPAKSQQGSWWLTGPGILLLGAILTGAMAWWLIAFPVFTFSNTETHSGHFVLVYVHMVGGTTMLVLGAANLYIGSTRRFLRFHKLIGYGYILGGGVGSLLSIVLALATVHSKSPKPVTFSLSSAGDAGVALASLGAAWLVASSMGVRAGINRRFDSHQAWMVRSYVLTWSFVLCRLVGKVPALSGLGIGSAMIWLTWVGPLLLCEIALQWASGGPPSNKPNPLRGAS